MAKTAAATVSERISLGGTDYLYIGTITPDTSYETGGDTLTKPAAPAVTLPEKIKYMAVSGNGGGYIAQWVPSEQKLKLFESNASGSALKEVTAAANLSAQVFTFLCIGA